MAHNELLAGLGLPPDALRRDSDTFSLSSSSSSHSGSAKSISLNDDPPPSPPAAPPRTRTPVDRTSRTSQNWSPLNRQARLLDFDVLSHPSSMNDDTELAMDSSAASPPTTRTSISSQVPSFSFKGDQVETHDEDDALVVSSHTVGPESSESGSRSPKMTALADALSGNIAVSRSASLSSYEAESERDRPLTRASTASSVSSIGRKVRPDSLLVKAADGPLVLGIALIDFNHSVGPRVEMAHPPSLLLDEELCKILPFLALPDGAHQSSEDYSYFHLTLEDPERGSSSAARPDTAFGISCNRQIAAQDLLERDADVSRSTVQKAVVVLASKPLFGMIRDRLGVVTSALFNQRDFRDTHILVDFYTNLELSLRTQLTESGLYMGTNLRELIHKFRHRTLILLKLLMLQKKIMFYGHPVERLCTYQYSLVSLIPNLLIALEDAASPNLDSREKNATRPTELKTSDRNSLLRYLGLPLNVFGKDAFFQPYLPLQQVDMLKTQSWLCGTTNTIVTQQRDCAPDLLVNIEQNTFEFKDPRAERLAALTPADRKWMDDIVKDVNESWNDKDPSRPLTMQFKGSDDYLRAKFEDYVCSALSTVKYADYLLSTGSSDMGVIEATGDQNCIQNFGETWVAAFRLTNAYTVWNQVTDPALFDICEARHPCESKPTPITDIGLRLAEGIYELKVAETVAPAREAISNAVAVGSTGFFRAFETVRSEVSSRLQARQASSASSPPPTSPSPALVATPLSEVSSFDGFDGGRTLTLSNGNAHGRANSPSPTPTRASYPPSPATPTAGTSSAPTVPAPMRGGLRPLSLAPSATAAAQAATAATEIGATAGAAAKATLSSWGSFLAKKASEYKKATTTPVPAAGPIGEEPVVVKSDTVPSAASSRSIASSKPTALRSPPLGFRGALWTLGERADPQAGGDAKS